MHYTGLTHRNIISSSVARHKRLAQPICAWRPQPWQVDSAACSAHRHCMLLSLVAAALLLKWAALQLPLSAPLLPSAHHQATCHGCLQARALLPSWRAPVMAAAAAACHHRHAARRPQLGCCSSGGSPQPELAARLAALAPCQAVLPAAAQQLTSVCGGSSARTAARVRCGGRCCAATETFGRCCCCCCVGWSSTIAATTTV